MTEESKQAEDPLSQDGAEEEEKKQPLPPTTTAGKDESPTATLTALGYKIYIGEPHSDKYGVLRQLADPTKGIEWKGQANYDFIAETLIKVI
jgi:hypothetical protein